jgi:hypothetical protein
MRITFVKLILNVPAACFAFVLISSLQVTITFDDPSITPVVRTFTFAPPLSANVRWTVDCFLAGVNDPIATLDQDSFTAGIREVDLDYNSTSKVISFAFTLLEGAVSEAGVTRFDEARCDAFQRITRSTCRCSHSFIARPDSCSDFRGPSNYHDTGSNGECDPALLGPVSLCLCSRALNFCCSSSDLCCGFVCSNDPLFLSATQPPPLYSM